MSLSEPRTVRGTVCNRPDFAGKVAAAVRRISGAAVPSVQLPNVREECKTRVEVAAQLIELAEPDDIRLAGLHQLLLSELRWRATDEYDPSPSSATPMPAQHKVLIWFGGNAQVPHNAAVTNRCAPEHLLGELQQAAAEDALAAVKQRISELDDRAQRAEAHRGTLEERDEENARLTGENMQLRDDLVRERHEKAEIIRERDDARVIAEGVASGRKRTTSLKPEAEAEAAAA